MLTPCESILKQFIPAVRASITKELSSKYNFTQTEIATKLGLTQAAVSNYLSGKYGKKIKNLEKNKEIKNLSKKTSYLIAKKGLNKPDIIKSTCAFCTCFNKIRCEVGR